jgi:membrane associated rhomboid family serine protease
MNYSLMAANVLVFLILDGVRNPSFQDIKNELVFEAGFPRLYQFFTYQFLHADVLHLVSNMLFLWVFGNAVNGKMGQWTYLVFYLACGVFAAWGFALGSMSPMLGASGSIAGITTAYLVLFPRSEVTVMYIFFFIGFFEIPAIILIGLKVILWDNIIAPSYMGPGNVATSAHLAGYVFGFVVALFMLAMKGLPRDQFDMLSLWKRWNQRREFASAMVDPTARARGQYGKVARPVAVTDAERSRQDSHFDQVTDLRSKVSDAARVRDLTTATRHYEELLQVDPSQCMPQDIQIELGREFYATGRFPQAAVAFERFAQCYPQSSEVDEVRLLLGIIYARDLRQYETAEKHLSRSLKRLNEGPRRAQCLQWLQEVRLALGKHVGGAESS